VSMSPTTIEVSVRGRQVTVPAVDVAGVTVIVRGAFPRLATIRDEAFVDTRRVHEDVAAFVDEARRSALPADILAFAQPIDDPTPRGSYPFDWDNAAAVDTRSFDKWWEKLPQATRKNCRRAERRGARTDLVHLDEQFALQIKCVYDESPVRQGRRFWHYGKDVATILRENSSYLEKSDFIATFLNDELIGFMKVVYVGRIATIMQILARASAYDARPMNALIAKAVQVCSTKGISHLSYGKFQYGNHASSSLIEFKVRNGFTRVDYPRYFIPLTVRGRVAFACRLHRSLLEILPPPAVDVLQRIRAARHAVPTLGQHGTPTSGSSDERAVLAGDSQ
jgi:hypothetical protein